MHINFDNIDQWGPELNRALLPNIPDDIIEEIRHSELEYVEDATDLLFELYDRREIVVKTKNWIESHNLVTYHGTRLTNEDIDSICKNGLLVLSPKSRALRLRRALSRHPTWKSVEHRLEEVIEELGHNHRAGKRAGQVHLTLSREGIIGTFDHYITHGSEFDQHVAHRLLGEEGIQMLAQDGTSRILSFSIPGDVAFEAANHFSSSVIDDGQLPNLVRDFVNAWSFKISNPSFQSSSLRADTGLIFYEDLKPEFLFKVETL